MTLPIRHPPPSASPLTEERYRLRPVQASTTAGARVIRGKTPFGLTQFVTSGPLIRTRQGWLPSSRQASMLRVTVWWPCVTRVLPQKSGGGSFLQAVRMATAHASAAPIERYLRFSMPRIATKNEAPHAEAEGLDSGG
jgi:hypothetical protein